MNPLVTKLNMHKLIKPNHVCWENFDSFNIQEGRQLVIQHDGNEDESEQEQNSLNARTFKIYITS